MHSFNSVYIAIIIIIVIVSIFNEFYNKTLVLNVKINQFVYISGQALRCPGV